MLPSHTYVPLPQPTQGREHPPKIKALCPRRARAAAAKGGNGHVEQLAKTPGKTTAPQMLPSSSLRTAARPPMERRRNTLNGACELTGSVREDGTRTGGVALMEMWTTTLHHAELSPIQQPENITSFWHICYLQSWTSPQGLQAVPTQSSFLWASTAETVLEEEPSLRLKIAQSFRVTPEMLSGTSVTLTLRVKGKDRAMY